MIARVHVIPADQYQQWLTTQRNEINAANDQVTQLRQQLQANGNL
jgi:heme/copper-type cytochrome/quinol oxidase subunit 2